ncbi:hypothetical protein BS78_07G143300 [Paspalum vaginatum]|nr:hypothetical protein BS78_07G143300 [Paspalum vaginatum]
MASKGFAFGGATGVGNEIIVQKRRCARRGTDVSIENMHQGFTHVFESTFESTGGVKEYIEHPAHVEFANQFLPVLEKALMIDYKPASVN